MNIEYLYLYVYIYIRMFKILFTVVSSRNSKNISVPFHIWTLGGVGGSSITFKLLTSNTFMTLLIWRTVKSRRIMLSRPLTISSSRPNWKSNGRSNGKPIGRASGYRWLRMPQNTTDWLQPPPRWFSFTWNHDRSNE